MVIVPAQNKIGGLSAIIYKLYILKKQRLFCSDCQRSIDLALGDHS